VTERFSSSLGTWRSIFSWPAALIGILVARACLSLAIKPASWAITGNAIVYFLLLLLATSFAIRNAVQNTLGSRPFWMLLGVANGLWAVDQWLYLYYGIGLNTDVPDNSIADPVLFLHLVPLMAAVATLPHRRVPGQRPYRLILNVLCLLFFWTFFYGYAVFPYQYLFPNATTYAVRFDILYLLENLVVVVIALFVSLRARAPWQSIYVNLLVASVLYALSSTVANLAIDSGGYANGKLYGWGLTASACCFAWIPLRGRQLARAEENAIRSSAGHDSLVSVWAMLAAVLISIPIVWLAFQRNENPDLRRLRLVVSVAALVGLASVAFVAEYLGKRELASRADLNHDRLRLAMESGKSVGWDWDVKTGRDVWFGDLKTMFGVPSDHYEGRVEDFLARVHPDDRRQVWKTVTSAKQNRELCVAECRILWSDGTVRWIATQGKFYYAADGTPVRMLGIAVDISERKRAEESLRRSEAEAQARAEELSVILDAVPGIALICRDPACDWITGSRAAYELLRLPYGTNISKSAPEGERPSNFRIFKDGRELPACELPIQKALSTGQEVRESEITLLFGDGTSRDIFGNAAPLLDHQGKIRGAVGVFVDVSERKRTEMALRRSEESYRNFVAQSSEGIFRQDLDAPIPVNLAEDELVRRILYDSYMGECNDAICKMYGLSSNKEFLGKRLTETLDPNDVHNIELTRDYVRSGFRVLERESHEVDMRGNPKVFLNSMIGIVENGELVRTWGIQRDITERVRSEEARVRAEQALQESRSALARVARIVSMGELTASIAHEINQPLAAVVTNSSASLRWLAAQPPNLAESREAMTRAMQEANRASRVIERIRTLLKKASPEMRPLNVNEVIREVLGLTRSELLTGGVAMRTKLSADTPPVLGDRVQLQQVILNLIMNAIDALTAITDRRRELFIKSAKHADGVLIRVQDSGRGLDPDANERIFEPFFTTKPEGIGMGLAISRSIVEAHGGRLWATPGFPHGTVLQLILPIAESNA
jgi:PAS domain S-box-containing protein